MSKLIIRDEEYQILACERKEILHPIVFGYDNYELNEENKYSFLFMIEDYKLKLLQMELCSYEQENIHIENETKKISYEKIVVPYSGAVLVANDYIQNYFFDRRPEDRCFAYQNVKELIFQDGILITTIEHNKAMLRIRKNIDLGYRRVYNTRDFRCIERFIKNTLIGNYRAHSSLKRQLEYYNELVNYFEENN